MEDMDQPTGLSRKRSREDMTISSQNNTHQPSNTSATSDNTDSEMKEPPTSRPKGQAPNITGFNLEAIFHPKFENENQNDQQIRKDMIAQVSSQQGYLEVTLKHSGSLMLWSGGQKFYSKNSTSNLFTAVGEILLLQHFARAWGATEEDLEIVRQKVLECSDYIEQHRLCLSFEVVSTVLGHHGDIPNRNYLMLIAVADKKQERFFSTAELTAFAQRFRLPHNDAWLYASKESVDQLFELYDTTKETGMASSVALWLDNSADGGIVASMYPHSIFQGEILEGLVIRYVPYRIKEGVAQVETLQEMKRLGHMSTEIWKQVPPEKTLNLSATGNVWNLDLSAISEDESTFAEKVHAALDDFHGTEKRQTTITSVKDLGVDILGIAKEVIGSKNANGESVRIAKLIQQLVDLNIKMSFKVIQETTSAVMDKEETRYIAIIHIHHDESFQKYYRKTKDTDAMSLFRGFSIELLNFAPDEKLVKRQESSASIEAALDHVHLNQKVSSSEEKLMLKMKFLPYMVRTFICRNGLSKLQVSRIAFEEFALNQLVKWKVSEEGINKWMPFFKGYAKYCQNLQVTSNKYLHTYNEFSKLYQSGEFQVEDSGNGAFRGVILMVGLKKEELAAMSNHFAKELACSFQKTDCSSLTRDDFVRSLQRSEGGLICTTNITDSMKKFKKLSKGFQGDVYTVLVGCSESELESSLTEAQAASNEVRKTLGIAKGLRKNKGPLHMISKASLSTATEDLKDQEDVVNAVKALRDAGAPKEEDKRFGLIVFFPAIPGQGKSSLCGGLSRENLDIPADRQLIIREGDKVQGKYYRQIEKEIISNPACIFIADKNVPPVSWHSISDLCLKSRSVAVAVVPDVLKDTIVGTGLDKCSYPFSLHFLALCILRVLQRPSSTHNGKLDLSCKQACMVVVKFYCFYRHKTMDHFDFSERQFGTRKGKMIKVPFFKDRNTVESVLPPDLHSTLCEAIQLQTLEDQNKQVDDSKKNDMENNLRSSILKHEAHLQSLVAPIEESMTVFQEQLKSIVGSIRDAQPSEVDCPIKTNAIIKLASLDIDESAVRIALEKIQKENAKVRMYFSKREKSRKNDPDNIVKPRFIKKTHCTFAHISRNKQKQLRETFGHLVGESVEVHIVSFYYAHDSAALGITFPSLHTIESNIPFPTPQNDFHHVTVFCGAKVMAHISNSLPERHEKSEADLVTLKEPIKVKGTFSFWYS